MQTEATCGRAWQRADAVQRPVRARPVLRRARRSRALPLILCGLIGAGAFALLTDGGRTARGAQPLTEQIDTLLVDAGFGINEVWLTGHRYTVDADLFAALDLENAGSLLRFDPRRARARIEKLSWVETAAVTRIFPDQLRVEVRERQPFAIWMYGGREALVDATGRLLAYVTPGMTSDLPRIRGDEAPAAAAELLAEIRKHSEIASRLQTADRIAGRRWTLQLEPSIAVHLPALGPAGAIARLSELQARHRLLDQGYMAVDLRTGPHIAIRRNGAVVSGSASGAAAVPGGS